MAQQSAAVVAVSPLEQAKALHEKAKDKDSEAMYALAILVILEAPKSEAEYNTSEWPKFGGRFVLGRHALLEESASLGNRNAAAYLCKFSSDPGAPARVRSSRDKWCSAQ